MLLSALGGLRQSEADWVGFRELCNVSVLGRFGRSLVELWRN